MSLQKRWSDHLKKNNMTYRDHWWFAVSHGLLCIIAGVMLVIHSLFPCFFEQAGSRLVRKLRISFDKHQKDIRK